MADVQGQPVAVTAVRRSHRATPLSVCVQKNRVLYTA
jgi:hypothetical protein